MLGRALAPRVGKRGRTVEADRDVLHLHVAAAVRVFETEIEPAVPADFDFAANRFVAAQFRDGAGPNRFGHQPVRMQRVDADPAPVDLNHFPGECELAAFVWAARKIDQAAGRFTAEHAARVGAVRGDDFAVVETNVSEKTLVALNQCAADELVFETHATLIAEARAISQSAAICCTGRNALLGSMQYFSPGESMAKRPLKYVGRSVPRVDGVDKVTGKAKFVGDITVPGMLYGKILRSPFPHARIRAIDAKEAEALPGVAAVLTASDIADLNPIYNGRPIIAINKVRYVGEPVAAVAASDPATAEEALERIQVDYEELPAVVGIEAATAKDAPLVHDDKAGNIGTHEKVRRGDADAGFAESDEIVEDTFTFPMVYHYAMEPHSVIAHHDGDEITVWSSAQHPFQVRGDIAKLFKVPAAKVRLIINYLGGGYGSKSYTKFEPLVVGLARKAGQPGRICNSVGASMVTVRRHGARVRIKTGVKRDGTIMAREAEIYLDTGGYDDNGPQVTARSATRIIGPYWIPNIRTDAYQVYTNTGSAGSYRAIGAPQVIFAGESQIEMLATKLGMDPAELRAKNLLEKGQELRPGLKGIDADLSSSLKSLVRASGWKKSLKKQRAAIGMGCAITNAGATPVSVAMIRMQSDGVAT